MKLSELIKTYRKENKLTMQTFADKSGLSKGYISMLENDFKPTNTNKKIIPSLDVFKKLANAMELDINHLLSSVDSEISLETADSLIPVEIVYDDYFPLHFYSGLSAGSFEELMSAEPDSIVYVPIKFQLKKDHLNAFKVNGTSMDNIIVDGSIVVTEDTHNNAIPISDGDVAVVFYNGEATVKKVYNQEDRILLMPDSTDKAHLPITIVKEDTEIYIIGKVIWHMNPDDISKIY